MNCQDASGQRNRKWCYTEDSLIPKDKCCEELDQSIAFMLKKAFGELSACPICRFLHGPIRYALPTDITTMVATLLRLLS